MGALDYNTSKDILQLIEEVNHKYHNTIIIVTHNDAIKNMADHIIKLRDGKIGKYLVIFLFITLTIAFVSGFLVADNSMKTAYDQSFNKYNVEDGNFELSSEITSELNNNLESKENIDIYKNWYLEKSVLSDETLRIFSNRLQINLA